MASEHIGRARRRPARSMCTITAIFVSLYSLQSIFTASRWLKLPRATSSEDDGALRLATTAQKYDNAKPAKISATTVVMSSSKNISADGQPTSCHCELLSRDCLQAIECIPRGGEGRDLERSIARGIHARSIMRKMARFRKELDPYEYDEFPIGKLTQYSTMDSWVAWTDNSEKGMPTKHGQSMFVNGSMYPSHCAAADGLNCFFRSRSSADYHDAVESAALSNFPPSERLLAATESGLASYRKNSRTAGHTLPAWDHLRAFAHLCRMQFNIRRPIIDSYRKHLVTENPKTSGGSADPLRVSLHVRRADACEHEREGSGGRYMDRPSGMNSPAQVSGRRRCYNTAVYMRALHAVRRRSGRPLAVYLSTDYAGTLIREIEAKHPRLYRSCAWKYLDFPRDTFAYQWEIETDENKPTHAILGETAVADLWHMSHGQVYVGHMGSRFGKVAWLLATARYDSFVPFYTVDGRSYCCEIDEVCGDASLYVKSMEHCLVFAHELFDSDETPENRTSYWTVGSTVRKRYTKYKLDQLARLNSWLGDEMDRADSAQ